MSEKKIPEWDYRSICFKNHGRTCIVCSAEDRIEVHHRNGDQEENTPENLAPRCHDCHMKVHTESYDHAGLLKELHEDLPIESLFGKASYDLTSPSKRTSPVVERTRPKSSARIDIENPEMHAKKVVDSSGRVYLGKKFKNRTVTITVELEEDEN